MRKEVWIAAAVIAADQGLKAAARNLPEGGITLIPGILGLQYAENRGIAFSMLSGAGLWLGILSLAAAAGMILLAVRKKPKPFEMTALMLMTGGTLGNGIDRVIHGYVTDMIEVLFTRFAIFNLADAALVVGCGMMVVSLLFRPGTGQNKNAA